MGKRIIACTSTGCLDYYPNNYDIRSVRIKLEIDGKLYADGTEMPADKFYELLKNDPTLIPKTTQTPMKDLMDFFEGLYAEGYDEVFVCTISSKMSGTINGIDACAELLKDKMRIVSYDTRTVCFNEGIFALKAAEMTEKGATIEQIIEELDYMRDHNLIMFAVEHLDFLIKNGRLSNASGFFANLLNIKPLLEVQNDGQIVATQKIRSIQRALDAVVERGVEYTKGHKYFAYYVYTTDERLPYLKQKSEQAGLNVPLQNPCSPIVGCHVGNGALGLGIFLERD